LLVAARILNTLLLVVVVVEVLGIGVHQFGRTAEVAVVVLADIELAHSPH